MTVFSRWRQATAIALCSVFMAELLVPTVAHALTSGPAQPEYTSFEPLGTTGMVNEFNGGFTYNIPLLEVPGPHGSSYPVTLSYHSGGTAEEDASWVGFGWTLNAGAISRGMRGLPDDANGEDVRQINKMPASETWMTGAYSTLQVASYDVLEFNAARRYNNYTGYSVTSGSMLNILNLASVGTTTQNGVKRFSATVDWSRLFSEFMTSTGALAGLSATTLESASTGPTFSRALIQEMSSVYGTIGSYLMRSFSTTVMPNATTEYSGVDKVGKFGVTAGFMPGPVLIGLHQGIIAGYSKREATNEIVRKGYGYLYQGAASLGDDMTDHSSERETPWTSRDRYLSPAYHSYDQFTCNAQGIGGGLRLVHDRAGYTTPVATTSQFDNIDLGLEAGGGPDKLTIGGSLRVGTSIMTLASGLGAGHQLNGMKHRPYSSANNRAMMRFGNDPADNVSYASDTKAVAPSLVFGVGTGLELVNIGTTSGLYSRVNNWHVDSVYKRLRSSSSVSYRTNKEMVRGSTLASKQPSAYSAALHDTIIDRTEKAIADGIGEISVKNPGGMQYVFGLPVYARNERTLQFVGRSVHDLYRRSNRTAFGTLNLSTPGATGMVRTAPYATTWLMTEIRTPDYVDRTMDGPTLDDFGGYTQFGYRRTAGTREKGTFTDSVSKKWFKWRTPYQGYSYSPGRLTQTHDDRGAVAMGEKEMYFLSKIETKTHTAFFVTNKTNYTVPKSGGGTIEIKGSQSTRMDAFEAWNTGMMDNDEEVCGNLPGPGNLQTRLAMPPGVYNNKFVGGVKRNRTKMTNQYFDDHSQDNKSEYLEKVILIAKDEAGNYTDVIKTTNLEYTYEVMQTPAQRWVEMTKYNARTKKYDPRPVADWDTVYSLSGMLNSAISLTSSGVYAQHTTSAAVTRMGKLTLKRVWTDYGTALNARISPYEFQYTYRRPRTQSYPAEIKGNSLYNDVITFDSAFARVTGDATAADSARADSLTAAIQNPYYDPVMVDAWGGLRWNGFSDGDRYREHYSQEGQDGSIGYDAGAWQLKIIRLPSGGEIRVQYEQNTYSHVQNEPAMALVPIKNVVRAGDDWSFDLDLAALPGRDPATLRKLVEDYARREKLFFKFLMPITPCPVSLTTTSVPDSAAEFLTGYADIDANNVTLQSGNTVIRVKMTSSPKPPELLREFIRNERMMINTCGREAEEQDLTEPGTTSKAVFDKLDRMGGVIQANAMGIESFTASPGFGIYKANSYVRIPCQFKYGGGPRVKRVFLYDPGIETGRAAIYGNEYLYDKVEAGVRTSYGVATNEPGMIREESALVKFLIGRDEQQYFDKLAAGVDMEQFEGPIAASQLPGASIGYGRVIVKNIVSTGSEPGFTAVDFFTARDYPVKMENTDIDDVPEYFPPINLPILAVRKGGTSATQGYAIHHNAMHGRVKAMRKCSGAFSSFNERTWQVVESIEHEYYEPGEEIPVLSVNAEGEASITTAVRGMEMDLHTETHAVHDLTAYAKVDADVGVVFPLAVMGHVAPPQALLKDQYLKTATITKVISYAVFEKSTKVVRDGRTIRTENVAFDDVTGAPIIVRTYDEFAGMESPAGTQDGSMVDYTIPAYMVYPAMGPASDGEGLQATGTTVSVSGAVVTIAAGAAFTSHCTPGDVVMLQGSAGTAFAQVTSISGANLVCGHVTNAPEATASSGVTATVVRSGRTNQLTAVAGKILRSGTYSPGSTNVWNLTSGVVAASATTWGDTWDYDTTLIGGLYATAQKNDYARGIRGKWRPSAQYVYQDSTFDLSATHRAWEAGRAASTYEPFPYGDPASRTVARWIRTSNVIQYSPNGDMLEEQNAIGISSVARFGHQGSVPSIIARNAESGTALFESFEDRYGSPVTSTENHTGRQSLALQTTAITACTVKVNQHYEDKGMLLRGWYRGQYAVSAKLGGTTLPTPVQRAYVAGWKLMEWNVPAGHASLTTHGAAALTFQVATNTGYIDDVRVQPQDAEGTCYVYERTSLRLLAQLDDRHFAVIYRYNNEGRLMRKERETERGIVPLSEAEYNTPSIAHYTRKKDYVGTAPLRVGMSPAGVMDGRAEMLPGTLRKPAGMKAGGDMLDIRITPERRRVKLFGDTVNALKPNVLKDGVRKYLNTNQNTSDEDSTGEKLPTGGRP